MQVASIRIELIFSVLIKGLLLTGFFSRYSTHGNPFDYVDVEDEAEDVLAENEVSPTACVSFCLCHYWKNLSKNRSKSYKMENFLGNPLHQGTMNDSGQKTDAYRQIT